MIISEDFETLNTGKSLIIDSLIINGDYNSLSPSPNLQSSSNQLPTEHISSLIINGDYCDIQNVEVIHSLVINGDYTKVDKQIPIHNLVDNGDYNKTSSAVPNSYSKNKSTIEIQGSGNTVIGFGDAIQSFGSTISCAKNVSISSSCNRGTSSMLINGHRIEADGVNVTIDDKKYPCKSTNLTVINNAVYVDGELIAKLN